MREQSAKTTIEKPSKRERLLDAAEALFARRGYANTRIAQIVAQAGTGISTFYRHFPTKEALLEAGLARRLRQVRAELESVRVDVESRPFAEQIAVMWKTFEIAFDALVGRPGLTRMLFTSGFGSSDTVRELVRGQLATIARDLAQVLERIEDAEGIRIPNKQVLAQASVGAVLHLAYTHLCDGAPGRGEAVQTLMAMFAGAIAVANPVWAATRLSHLREVMR